MTREDAIYEIRQLAVLSTNKDIERITEALNMAIEALQDEIWKDEPCDKCVFVKGSGWCDNCNGKPKGLDALPNSRKAEQTENSSEILNNCDDDKCNNCMHMVFDGYWYCECRECKFEPKDEPQTERIKTLDYCDICNHKGCDNCIANSLDDYCVPSNYAPNDDTPQTDADFTYCPRCGMRILTDTPQTDDKDTNVLNKSQTDCAWK